MPSNAHSEIELSQGLVALCDPSDAEFLRGYRWHALRIHKRIYAATTVDGRRSYMHRMLMPDVREVDHRDRNGLNNRRENLRACTHSQNIANADFPHGVSGFRGVRRNKARWQARIKVHQKTTCLGTYDTPEEAARVYDAVARTTFGEFAYQNIPQ